MEQLKKLTENKVILYSIIGVVILIFAIMLLVGITAGKGGGAGDAIEQPIKTDVDLLTTDNIGKAIEIQALLARSGIAVSRSLDGTKSRLYLKGGDCITGAKKCTTTQRDQALILIVQSGLVDQNVGLEIFDKGDFTSTKEDKKIRLTRAVNGELARLIRKIKPIENASVFISIPEDTSSANNMGSMFSDCFLLTSLDVSHFVTPLLIDKSVLSL